jgi:hypothetical protein
VYIYLTIAHVSSTSRSLQNSPKASDTNSTKSRLLFNTSTSAPYYALPHTHTNTHTHTRREREREKERERERERERKRERERERETFRKGRQPASNGPKNTHN